MVVAVTLVASLRASGVAHRPRRIVEVLLFIGVLGLVLVLVVGWLTDAGVEGVNSGKPSFLWSVVATISPIVVLRRVMKHPTITMSTF